MLSVSLNKKRKKKKKRFIQMVHGIDILWLVLHSFPSYTVICMRLPDLAFIFTAEVLAIIKALEQLKIQLHPNILFLQTHFRVSKLYSV